MASNPLRARACVYLVASADPIVGLGASTFAVKASLLHILREFYLYVSIMTLGCDKTRPRPLQTSYQARVHHAVSLGERGMRCSLPRNDGNRGRGRGEGNRDQGHLVHFLADVGDGGGEGRIKRHCRRSESLFSESAPGSCFPPNKPHTVGLIWQIQHRVTRVGSVDSVM